MMARLLGAARVPVPATRGFAQLGQFAAVAEKSVTNWPVVIKSRRSRRGDLVRRVDTRADLAALLADWSTEPVIVQEYVASDGYDLKFWVVGPSITVARRPSALEVRTKTQDVALDIEAIPASWRRAVLAAGAALGLEIYGVDGLITGGRMVVVDVNPFPGFRSAAGADRALADLVERRAREAGRST
jgi:ribosomal protein S6--L-glutamate ligase